MYNLHLTTTDQTTVALKNKHLCVVRRINDQALRPAADTADIEGSNATRYTTDKPPLSPLDEASRPGPISHAPLLCYPPKTMLSPPTSGRLFEPNYARNAPTSSPVLTAPALSV